MKYMYIYTSQPTNRPSPLMFISVCGLTKRLEHYSQWLQQHMWTGSVFNFFFLLSNFFFYFQLVHSIVTIDIIDRPIDSKSSSLVQRPAHWKMIMKWIISDTGHAVANHLLFSFDEFLNSLSIDRAFKTGEHWSLL